MDEGFKPLKDFDLDEFMKHSFKVMHDELYTVKIRISGALAPFAPLRTHQDQPRPKRRTHAG